MVSQSGGASGAADREPRPGDKALERRYRRLAEFVSDNLVAVLSAVGASVYFLTRLTQTSFYSKFGVEPEDVGLGYAETLSRAAVGLLLVSLVVLVLLFAFSLVDRWLLGTPTGRRERLNPRALVIIVGVAFVILLAWMPRAYWGDADRVKEGKPVRPAGLSSMLRIVTNPLGLRVEPVRVEWLDNTHAAYDFKNEVMYLGRANGIAVFYDRSTKKTVRAPETDILIQRNR